MLGEIYQTLRNVPPVVYTLAGQGAASLVAIGAIFYYLKRARRLTEAEINQLGQTYRKNPVESYIRLVEIIQGIRHTPLGKGGGILLVKADSLIKKIEEEQPIEVMEDVQEVLLTHQKFFLEASIHDIYPTYKRRQHPTI